MNPTPDTEGKRWIVICEDAADGTGDLILPLPDDLLAATGLACGDKLEMKKQADGVISLTPVRS